MVVFKVSLVLIVVGLFFKLGLIPFHMWLPDVYAGAPTSVGVFIAIAPKLAVFIVAYRVLKGSYNELIVHWQNIIILLAALSIGFGNIVAIAQSNIKRMLAYSTIANIGFAVLGLITGDPTGFSAAMFYIIVYALIYLGVFGVVLLLSSEGIEFDNIADFRGLGARSPLFATIMATFMFSIAGLPPTAGFYAKFLVLNAMVGKGYIGLAVLILLFSVVGAFYCLKIIKTMFFDKALDDGCFIYNDISYTGTVVLSINSLAVLLLGIFPNLLYMCISH